MALDASSQGGGTTISQINVTPLVDVMLVLLVIFMVTAPIIQQGVQVNLPQAKAGAIAGSDELLIVTIAKNGKIYLNDNEMTLADLGKKLEAIKHYHEETGASYPDSKAAVEAVITRLRQSGLSNLR